MATPVTAFDTTGASTSHPLVDSYTGQQLTGKMAPGQVFNYSFTNLLPQPASAVVLSVTTSSGITSPAGESNGYFYAYTTVSGSDPAPTLADDPHPSPDTLANSGFGAPAENTAIVETDDHDQVSFYVGSTTQTNLNVTVVLQGYIEASGDSTAGDTFQPLPAADRVFDTRGSGVNTAGAMVLPGTGTNHARTFQVLGAADNQSPAGHPVPNNGTVAAVAINVGAADSTSYGSVGIGTTAPTGSTVPTTAQVVPVYPNNTDSHFMVVAPTSSGNIVVSTDIASGVDVFIDVEGYYLNTANGGTGEIYVPVTPTTIVNTTTPKGITTGTGPNGQLGASQLISGTNALNLTSAVDPTSGAHLIPSTGVGAVALNFTTYNAKASPVGSNGVGFITAFAEGSTRPNATTISVAGLSGATRREANLAYVKPSSAGLIDIYNGGNETTDLDIDIEGYFEIPSVPSAPTNAMAAVEVSDTLVAWSAPTTDGGASIQSYVVTTTPADVSPITVTDVDDMSTTVTGLSSSKSYTFTIAARNIVGTGPQVTATGVTAGSLDDDSLQSPAAANQAPTMEAGSTDQIIDGEPQDVAYSADIADTPVAIGPNGQQVTSQTTEEVTADEMAAPTPLNVLNTPSGGTFDLTGVVTDLSTGAAIPNASVTLASDTPGTASSTTADVNGGFAFAADPATSAGSNYTLTVNATGYGTFAEDASYSAGTPFETTAALTPQSQTIDDTALAGPDASLADSARQPISYASQERVPPLIRVGLQTINRYCNLVGSSTPTSFATYPFRYYILHVAPYEIDGEYSQAQAKANMAAMISYAWYHVLHPDDPQYDVVNSTQNQCFKPGPIPATHAVPSFKNWITPVLADRFIGSSDFTSGNGTTIADAQYNSGDSHDSCSRWIYNGLPTLSQLGSLHCSGSWQHDFNVFYPYHIASVVVPPRPHVTSSDVNAHVVQVDFPSETTTGGVVSKVGWKYQIKEQQADGNYVIDYAGGWNGKSLPTSAQLATTSSGCTGDLLIRAWNPSGWSQYTDAGRICA